MRRIVIKSNPQYLTNNPHSKCVPRGAQVFGLPVSPAVSSYIDDVSPQAKQERMLSMFFAGSYSGFEGFDDMEACEDEDDYNIESDSE